jgi:sulfur transfer complex TusBCD TusB component (DsrH family)
MPEKNKYQSVLLKVVIEIDGVQYTVKQCDYTESINEQCEETFISSQDVREIITQEIEEGETGLF